MSEQSYGATAPPQLLLAGPLPASRGPLTDELFTHLREAPHELPQMSAAKPAWSGEDSALALYCLYELHYRGFADVDDGWEWEPSLLGMRRILEADLIDELRGELPPAETPGDITDALCALASSDGPSVSTYLFEQGTREQMSEFLLHRSAFSLKEADPFSWAIPRLAGAAKAALVEIQAEEYGLGREPDLHQNLYAVALRAAGLPAGYHAELARLPAQTLTAVNVMSLFGLHRQWRGALVGHLAFFEMTSVPAMSTTSAALRRLGYDDAARRFFDVHTVVDARHEHIAAKQLAPGLTGLEPALADDIIFGARAAKLVEESAASAMLQAWREGRTSLLPCDPPAPGMTLSA